jgi:lysophospholipase L1-like esterase
MRLYVFLREIRNKLRYKETVAGIGMPLDYNVYRTDYPSTWQEAWSVTQAIIVELNNEVRHHGARLVMLIIPTELQVYPERWHQQVQKYVEMQANAWDLESPNRRLVNFLKAKEIEFIDLLPMFREEVSLSDKQFYIPNDGHWNAEGHQLAAQAIHKTLTEHGLLN